MELEFFAGYLLECLADLVQKVETDSVFAVSKCRIQMEFEVWPKFGLRKVGGF